MATLSQALSAQDSAVIERWAVTEDKVRELVKRLVTAYDPVRVVAFGSWARGESKPSSDFDVTVLLDHEVADADAKYACKDGIDMEMDILVGQVERYKRFAFVIGSIFHAVATEGVVLYQREGVEEPFYVRPSEEELLKSKTESLQSFFRKAVSDEKLLNLIGQQDHDNAGFHGQQAIEKLFKLWLMAIDVKPPYTHDLVLLKEQMEQNGLHLPVIATDLKKLTEYAAIWRYDELPESSRIDLDVLRADVAKVRSHVVSELSRLGFDVG